MATMVIGSPVPATEAERDEFADRDRVRRIVLGAAQDVLAVALDEPAGGEHVDVTKLARRFEEAIREPVYEYRLRKLARAGRASDTRRRDE